MTVSGRLNDPSWVHGALKPQKQTIWIESGRASIPITPVIISKLSVSGQLVPSLKFLMRSTNGFSFSPTNTVAANFCRRWCCVRQPDLYKNNRKIEVKDQARFLGVIFDMFVESQFFYQRSTTQMSQGTESSFQQQMGFGYDNTSPGIPNTNSLQAGLHILH